MKVPEFSATILTGVPRSGKTLLMTLLGYDLFCQGYDVVANYHISFGNKISVSEIIDFKVSNKILLLDEIYTLIDARASAGVGNRLLSYFFFQAGKNNNKVFGTAQLIRTADVRIREILSEEIECEKELDKNKKIRRFNYMARNSYQQTRFSIELPLFEKIKKLNLYNHREIVMPLSISSEDVLTWDTVMEVYDECPNKQTFILEMKNFNPYLADKNFSSCYDWLKAGKESKAKKAIKL